MATTTNYSWTTPDDTDLVKDGASAIRSLGTAIDSTVFTNAGNAVQKSTIDAKGDLLVGTADNTLSRLAVGTNNYVLTADSAETTGLKWAAAGGGGKVLQVVSATYNTATTIASNTFTDTGLTASITPSAATSKVLIIVSQLTWISINGNEQGAGTRLLRGATTIYTPSTDYSPYFAFPGLSPTSSNFQITQSYAYVDSPNTTSSTAYKTQGKCNDTSNSGTSIYQKNNEYSSIILMEIGA